MVMDKMTPDHVHEEFVDSEGDEEEALMQPDR